MLQVVAHSLEKRKNTLRDRIVKGFVAFDSKIPSLPLILRESAKSKSSSLKHVVKKQSPKPSSLERGTSEISFSRDVVKTNSKMPDFVCLHSLKAHDNLSYISSQEVCHE